MKKISSQLNVNVLPDMVKTINKYIDNFCQNFDQNKFIQQQQNNGKKPSNNYGWVYDDKQFDVDLTNWSGLDQWYSNLQKIQKLTNHQENSIIKNVVLDPTLCIRQLNEQQAKKYTESDFFTQIKNNKNFSDTIMKIEIVIAEKIKIGEQSYAKGAYVQKRLFIVLQKNDPAIMKEVLEHEIIHFLDHLTALFLQQNCNKIIDVLQMRINDSKNIYTPKDNNEKIDLNSITENSNQFFSSFQDLYNTINKTYLDDMRFYHRDYYLQDMSFLMLCFITDYNYITNNDLTINIFEKAKSINQQKGETLEKLFKYIVNNNGNDTLYYMKSLKRKDNETYLNVVNKLFEKLKQIKSISEPNEFEKKILS